jgi:hypothetical protein
MPLHIKRLLFIYYGMYLLIFFSFPSARKSPTFVFGVRAVGVYPKDFVALLSPQLISKC